MNPLTFSFFWLALAVLAMFSDNDPLFTAALVNTAVWNAVMYLEGRLG
jgi:hypothetical protein